MEGGNYRCPNRISVLDKQQEMKVPRQKIVDNLKSPFLTPFSLSRRGSSCWKDRQPSQPIPTCEGKTSSAKASGSQRSHTVAIH